MVRENLVIVPVYNEKKNLPQFYKVLRRYYGEDVLFINDGSTDGSSLILSEFKSANTFILTQEERRGYGKALLLGFSFALEGSYKKIVSLDADLQHNPCWLPYFLGGLREYEVVLGSRYLRINECLNIPRDRLLINRYISFFLRELYGARFSDPFCGFRAYRRSFLEKASLEEESYGLALEILLEIVRLGASFQELPIEALYLDPARKFLDGLDNPRERLLYYLRVISKHRRKSYEKEFPLCKSSS